MSGIPFHATRMGQRFYEYTVPELVRQIESLNRNLERMAAASETDVITEETEEQTEGSSREQDP